MFCDVGTVPTGWYIFVFHYNTLTYPDRNTILTRRNGGIQD
jgi:hypothetical protein